MYPRSGAWKVLMIAPRSMTRATRSRPCEILMWSTAVSMAGNVLSTCSVRTPGSNGVYFFGSHVSVCAIPPAIQSTTTESAVAFETRPCCACSGCGSRPTSAASVAPAVAPMNARRPTSREKTIASSAVRFMCSVSMTMLSENQLELGLHHDSPQQIGEPLRGDAAGAIRIGQRVHGDSPFVGRRRTSQRVPVHAIDDLCRCAQPRARMQRRSRRWRNQPIHVGLRSENQESTEDRLPLRKIGEVLEPDHAAEPRKPATGNVVHEP